MAWTHFWDMHSGGGQKLDWPHIYIEAAGTAAEIIFYNKFGRNPNRVTCTCCGPDYSISTGEDLSQLSAYLRGCRYKGGAYVERGEKGSYNPYIPLEDYMASGKAKFIPASEISEKDRVGAVPAEGYVWAGD